MMLTLAAVAISAFCILMLCRGDPKRLRAARIKGPSHGKAMRRSLSIAACLPGLWLALRGDSPAFLVWIGGCAIVGWCLAVCFNRGQKAD